jgi:hypothetical protein
LEKSNSIGEEISRARSVVIRPLHRTRSA